MTRDELAGALGLPGAAQREEGVAARGAQAQELAGRPEILDDLPDEGAPDAVSGEGSEQRLLLGNTAQGEEPALDFGGHGPDDPVLQVVRCRGRLAPRGRVAPGGFLLPPRGSGLLRDAAREKVRDSAARGAVQEEAPALPDAGVDVPFRVAGDAELATFCPGEGQPRRSGFARLRGAGPGEDLVPVAGRHAPQELLDALDRLQEPRVGGSSAGPRPYPGEPQPGEGLDGLLLDLLDALRALRGVGLSGILHGCSFLSWGSCEGRR